MNSNDALAKLDKYLNEEYLALKGDFERDIWEDNFSATVKTNQRMLGATMFAQSFDVNYPKLEKLYQDYYTKIWNLYYSTKLKED